MREWSLTLNTKEKYLSGGIPLSVGAAQPAVPCSWYHTVSDVSQNKPLRVAFCLAFCHSSKKSNRYRLHSRLIWSAGSWGRRIEDRLSINRSASRIQCGYFHRRSKEDTQVRKRESMTVQGEGGQPQTKERDQSCR